MAKICNLDTSGEMIHKHSSESAIFLSEKYIHPIDEFQDILFHTYM